MKRTCVAGLNCSSIDRFRGWLFALLQVLILEPHGHPDDKFCFCSWRTAAFSFFFLPSFQLYRVSFLFNSVICSPPTGLLAQLLHIQVCCLIRLLTTDIIPSFFKEGHIVVFTAFPRARESPYVPLFLRDSLAGHKILWSLFVFLKLSMHCCTVFGNSCVARNTASLVISWLLEFHPQDSFFFFQEWFGFYSSWVFPCFSLVVVCSNHSFPQSELFVCLFVFGMQCTFLTYTFISSLTSGKLFYIISVNTWIFFFQFPLCIIFSLPPSWAFTMMISSLLSMSVIPFSAMFIQFIVVSVLELILRWSYFDP